MKSKNIYVLLAIFAVLIIIYVIQNISTDKMSVKESFIDLSQGVTKENIAEVDVYRPQHEDSALVLVRKEDGWVVRSRYNAPAKQTNIDNLLNKLTGLQGELRGENPELAADFGLVDTIAPVLVIKDGGGQTIMAIQIGKRGADYRGCFIKNKDSDAVYLTSEDLLQLFELYKEDSNPDSKRWVELKMIPFTKDELQKVKIISGGKSIELLNEEVAAFAPEDSSAPAIPPEKEWKKGKLSRGIELEDNRINSMLSRVVNFRAVDIANPDSLKYYGFAKPKYKVELTDWTGDSQTFVVGNKIEGEQIKYYTRLLGEDLIFIVAHSGFNNLFLTPFEKKK